ncbi:MAG: SIS domain-containing protein [Nitrospirae bacterium]|nr:SIS domain-containing protein [Nitrospirota bacterium]
MRKDIESYYKNIFKSLDSVKVKDKSGQDIEFYSAIEQCCHLILKQTSIRGKLMFIGNGASAAIAGHMAADFLKNGEMAAMAFNEASLLTCLSNDLGYKFVFEKPIEMFGHVIDILIAISSSGRSENILRGVDAALKKGCHVITLSGFDETNPLSTLGDYNFHVPIHSYGAVEVVHHSICHCIIDVIMKSKM